LQSAATVDAVKVRRRSRPLVDEKSKPQRSRVSISTMTTRDGVIAMAGAIRRTQLRKLVPLADTTIYELERRGEFPRRFYLSPRCVVWDLGEVNAWLANKRNAASPVVLAPVPTPPKRKRHRPSSRRAPA
jgi:prophage regulatory protein